MLRPLPPRERLAAGLWVVAALVVGNGVYDLLVSRGLDHVVLHAALAEAGRVPPVPLADIVGETVRYAAWVGTLWGLAVLLAGLATIRLLRTPPGR